MECLRPSHDKLRKDLRLQFIPYGEPIHYNSFFPQYVNRYAVFLFGFISYPESRILNFKICLLLPAYSLSRKGRD